MLMSIPQLLQTASANLRRIDSKLAATERSENDGLLIDVREPQEHASDPVKGAINIPRGLLEMKMLELEKDATRPIYMHCATSARATLAAEQLQRIGYSNVTVITCSLKDIQANHA